MVYACSACLTTSLSAADPGAGKVSPLDRIQQASGEQHVPERIALPPSGSTLGARSGTSAVAPMVEADSSRAVVGESAPGEEAPAPLDLPLSGFDQRRSGATEFRLPHPAMVKSVPQPYFDQPKAPAGNPAPLISLPDFLEGAPAVPPLVEAMSPDKLLPPEPIAAMAQLPVPDASVSNTPGMEDTVFRPISQIQPYYAYSPTGKQPGEYLCRLPSEAPETDRARCPEIQPLPAAGSTDRHFAMFDYCWVPSNLRHKPLYFEDVALERYGQKYPHGLQPFVSIAKFGVQGIGLPYQLAMDPIWRDIYPLGYYRPGDNAPELIYQVPFNLQAAAAAGGTYTGLIFLFP